MAGRGRGRGRGIGGPIARDDEGNIMETAGPPPLFPDVTLPDAVPKDDSIDGLRLNQRKVKEYWQNSPYNLGEQTNADAAKPLARVERWSDRDKRKQTKLTMSQAIFLTPVFFPTELYSRADKLLSASAGASEARAQFIKGSSNETEEQQKEREKKIATLTDRETKAQADSRLSQAGAAGKAGKQGAAEGEEEEEDEEEQVDEPDEDDFEDDDYLQYPQNDDDEGYVDDYADDGPAEALF